MINKDFNGAAIIAAAKKGDFSRLNEIINSGVDVDVNYQDSSGMTALHHAAMMNARPCIRVLVGSGKCDYLIRDNFKRYAVDLTNDVAVERLFYKKQAVQAFERGVPVIDRT